MIKTTPFSKTIGSEKFKEFLDKEFNFDILDPVSPNLLFEGWRNRGNLTGWSKYMCEDYTLECYPTYYTIKKNKPADSISYMLSIPESVDCFINDMDRFGVQLYWVDKIDLMFEPKEYLHTDNIKGYFEDLLSKMGKSHELI